jgi:hypothetical protein
MRLQRGKTDWNSLLDDLGELQRKWEAKKDDLETRGGGLWMHGVALGIETGRWRIVDEKASSANELEALLAEWESIANHKAAGPAAQCIKGVDFGIGLVITQVRRYLKRVARAKPPAFAAVRQKPPASVGHCNARLNAKDK